MLTTTLSLEQIGQDYQNAAGKITGRIVICAGTGCIANGAMKVFHAFEKHIREAGVDVVVDINKHDCSPETENIHLSGSGCQGFCAMGPLVNIMPDNIFYVKVTADDVEEIVNETIVNKNIVDRLLYVDPNTGAKSKAQEEINFYKKQKRLLLRECGVIDPESIGEYISRGGYRAAEDVYRNSQPKEVCSEMITSGLRGRGGGGFPTGMKWDFTRQSMGRKKYVICNGDEGDPGAFMDRSLMEGNPHRVLEGMMIAARAVEADEAFVYVRIEYPLAVKRMQKAIEDAKACGILGEDIFGTGKNLDIQVVEGAGAFVCGEETALMSSIEGKRGMPSPKPPYPAQSGLWGKPTVINNVETLAAVPLIFRNGAEWFRSMGTENSPGTKTFALTGHVANTGLIEVPFGTTLREIVFNIGGGVTDDEGNIIQDGFRAVQIGGPSGGCLTEEHLDLPLDFDNLKEVGAMVGSGGLVVINNKSCMVGIARYFMQFTQNESCGKCVPCREGTKQMLAMLDDVMQGNADDSILEKMEVLGKVISKASLCGLGKTAAGPVLSTISNFREEYEKHVHSQYCPTGNCKDLVVYEIDLEKCIGCTACARKCPVQAITGERKKAHYIDPEKCTKCDVCISTCKFNAIKN